MNNSLIGVDGLANLTVADGGSLRIVGDGTIGVRAGGLGVVTVSGKSASGPSLLEVGGDLFVGAQGSGNVSITEGAAASISQTLFVAAEPNQLQTQRVEVSGQGSLLQANRIQVGEYGNADLVLEEGAAIVVNNFVVAQQEGSVGVATVSGGASLTAKALGVSTWGDGTLNIIEGGQVQASRRFWVGFAEGGVSHVTVDGPGSSLDVAYGAEPDRGLLIGGEPSFAGGVGTLTVSNGGRVIAYDETLIGPNATANGTLIVTGADSLADFTEADGADDVTSIGNLAQGRMEVLDGARVLSEQAVIGHAPGAVGTTIIRDSGSQWHTRSLVVGEQGAGAIELAQGGHLVTTSNAAIGRLPASNGTVTVGDSGGPLSSWAVTGDLDVGRSGSANGGAGDLAIAPSGSVQVGGALRIGSAGRVSIEGGSLTVMELDLLPSGELAFESGSVHFAPSPAGERLVDDAFLADLLGTPSRLVAGQSLGFADRITLDGKLELDGGTLSVPAFNVLPAPSPLPNLDWRAGTLEITAGDLLIGNQGPFGESLYLTANHVLAVSGALVADGQLNLLGANVAFFQPSTITTGGELNAINATLEFDLGLNVLGDLNLINSTVLGDVAMGAGAMRLAGTNAFADNLRLGPNDLVQIDLGGLDPQHFDRLEVTGDAVLNGTLHLGTMAGFTPQPSDSFEIVSIGAGSSGTFAGLPEGALVGNLGGVDLFITYVGGDGNDVVVFARRVGADFNDDGFVNGADLAIWESAFAETDAADSNADGVTNGVDLLAWQRQYGLAVPAATAAVPEAHALLTVAMALLALLAKRPAFGKALTQ